MALGYFNWVESNPIYDNVVVKFPLRAEIQAVPKMRAMSLGMFFAFSGLDKSTYADAKARPEFARVCQLIEGVIYDQKFTGAASGLLKEALITRDLGLAEKVDHTSSDGTMSPTRIIIEAADENGAD
jgi:hypothetical protein